MSRTRRRMVFSRPYVSPLPQWSVHTYISKTRDTFTIDFFLMLAKNGGVQPLWTRLTAKTRLVVTLQNTLSFRHNKHNLLIIYSSSSTAVLMDKQNLTIHYPVTKGWAKSSSMICKSSADLCEPHTLLWRPLISVNFRIMFACLGLWVFGSSMIQAYRHQILSVTWNRQRKDYS